MSMSFKNFKSRMELVQRNIHNTVSFVNSGGCGFFAVELLKRMRIVGLRDAHLRIYDEEPENDLSELETRLRDSGKAHCIHTWNSNGIWFSHIAVECMDYVWDAESILPVNDKLKWAGYRIYQGSVSLETMEALTRSKEGWNSLYSRRQDNTVRAILNDAFGLGEAFEAA